VICVETIGLVQEGFTGSYPTVQRFVKAWREERRHGVGSVFIPQSFAPGEAYQFDWSYEMVDLGGRPTPVKVAHLRLCHSRVFLAVAYLREAQEMVFDAHWRAFDLPLLPARSRRANRSHAENQVGHDGRRTK
jgi:hypothetical protein